MPLFVPSRIKEARKLLRGIRKFVHYNKDLISEADLATIRGKMILMSEAISSADEERIREVQYFLVKKCGQIVPPRRFEALRENLEILLVTVIIAFGLRAYFLQPYRIPTSSMQPTLNGIRAIPMESAADFPGAGRRAMDYLLKGKSCIEVRLPREWGPVRMVAVEQSTRYMFLTQSRLHFQTQEGVRKTVVVRVPLRLLFPDTTLHATLWRDVQDARRVWQLIGNIENTPSPVSLVSDGRTADELPVYEAGSLLACGAAESGDQVLVNKLSYHFRKPRRGEVVVFHTSGIHLPPKPDGSENQGQFYIKRLAGLPGDSVELRPAGERGNATLWINGKLAEEPGMVRVMNRESGYSGYSFVKRGYPIIWEGWAGQKVVTLLSADLLRGGQAADKTGLQYITEQYLALGDNGRDSADSRIWGPVPEPNLLGPVIFAYWPVSSHWGRVD